MYFSDLKITRIFSNDMVNLFVQQKYIVLSMYKLLLTYIIFRVLIYGRVYTVYCIDHSVMLKYIQCNVTFIMIWLTYDCFYWLFMFITKFTQFIFPNEPQNEAGNCHKGKSFAQLLALSLFSFKEGLWKYCRGNYSFLNS